MPASGPSSDGSVAQSALPTPEELNRNDLATVLSNAQSKREFVAPMFEHIAARYDDFTRLFSFGMDARWKRTLLTWAAEHPAGRAVDVACGTGDLALALWRLWPTCRLAGLDVAHRMLAIARERARDVGAAIEFVQCDLEDTKLASGSVDLVTAGYAFRNASNLESAVRESARILRPGGRLIALDFYRPEGALWRRCFVSYLRLSGALVGWWWHRSPILYSYIAESIQRHVTATEFNALLLRCGLRVARERRYLLGGIAIHEAYRLSD